MKLRPAVWLVVLGVVVLDQAVKWWALDALADGHSIPILGKILSLNLAYNDGAALSLLKGHTWVVTAVGLVVTAGLAWYHGRARGVLGVTVFGAAIGGAIGNLIDRFFRGEGHGSGAVVDMIQYGSLFTGNIADIAIVGAAAVTILATWRGKKIMTDPVVAPTPVVAQK